MVWKLGKALCCMFLLAILGADPAFTKPDQTQNVVSRANATNQ